VDGVVGFVGSAEMKRELIMKFEIAVWQSAPISTQTSSLLSQRGAGGDFQQSPNLPNLPSFSKEKPMPRTRITPTNPTNPINPINSIIRLLCLCLLLFTAAAALAQEADKDPIPDKKTEADAKELSGMSIVGNDEAPKSLYIVPWKSSQIGVETSLHSSLDEKEVPVDRDVFMRQLDFYHVSTAK
jgi:hypothetical protein